MKLNNKGFSLVELLAVMVILAIILTIAIPSITASLARSEKKQRDAQIENIKASALINLKKSNFSSSAMYDKFNAGNCQILVEKLIKIGAVAEKTAKDKNGNTIKGCIGYNGGDITFYEINKSECNSGKLCGMK